MRDLEGKVALVTGGTRGIGKAISLDFARRGAAVVVVFFRNREAAEATCREIEKHDVKALAIRSHVGDPEKAATAFDEIAEAFGRLDIFISNAAQGVFRPLNDQGLKEWEWTFGANARAFFLGAKRAKDLMDGEGSIVAISSLGSGRVFPDYPLIGASKAAIEALVRYMSVEWGQQGIRVNAIAPSVVDTDELKIYTGTDELTRWQLGSPLGRLVTPQDVSDAVMFLTSSRASMITGQVLVIDGGAGAISTQWVDASGGAE